MRTLIVSDVHSNLAALEAVIRAAESEGPLDGAWCMGDVVGYGPRPVETVRLLRSLGTLCVMGNHDAGVIGRISLEDFNEDCRVADEWNATRLDDETREHLAALPETAEADGFTLVHGSPAAPLWDYLGFTSDPEDALALAPTPDVLVGHSHFQFVNRDGAFEGGLGRRAVRPERTVPRGEGRLIVNPGSVGQPRDGDPRAAYAVHDSDARTLSLRSAAYDVRATQRAMERAGLPEWLIVRLSQGR